MSLVVSCPDGVGPAVLQGATLHGVELPVLVIHKLPRSNLWIYLGFLCVLWGCFAFGLDTVSPFYSQIGFMLFKILLMLNGGKNRKILKREIFKK